MELPQQVQSAWRSVRYAGVFAHGHQVLRRPGASGPRVSLVDPSCEVTVAPDVFVWVALQGEWEVGRLRAGALFGQRPFAPAPRLAPLCGRIDASTLAGG